MDGNPFQAGKFAHQLRMSLWQEHLGVDPHDARLADPVASSTYRDLWLETGKANTALFEQVFPQIPSNRNTSLPEKGTHMYASEAALSDVEKTALMGRVRGHLVTYALDYLSQSGFDFGLLDWGTGIVVHETVFH